MKRFFKMIAVPALTLGLMLCGSAASAQKSPAFKAKYKIAEGADRETGAIDHCLIYDPSKSVEVKVFDCIMEEYTVKLTDHYPNIIDVRL